MIELLTTTGEPDQRLRVAGRRSAHPQAPEKPAALHSERCILIALDPSTGDYRLAIS